MTNARLVREFADCGVRTGLSDTQSSDLESARDAVAAALLRLVEAYRELPEIRNGELTFDLPTAMRTDTERLCDAAIKAPGRFFLTKLTIG